MAKNTKETKPAASAPEELSEGELDNAQGGIIAVLIGVTGQEPKIGSAVKRPGIIDGSSNIAAGDGSV